MKGIKEALKVVKESLKDWILSHEDTYWCLVFCIAIGLFALITAIGVGKVYSAEAAETYPGMVIDGVTVPDIRTLDWSKHTAYFETEYGYTGNIGEKIIRDHKYMIIVTNISKWNSGNHGHLWYIFTDEPVQYTDNSYYWLIADSRTDCYFEVLNGVVQGWMYGYGYTWNGSSSGYDENAIPCVIGSGNSSSKTMASTYNYREGQSQNNNKWPHSNINYPEKVLDNVYDTDAPYVTFKSLIIDNLLTDGTDDKNVSGHLYTDYFVPSYWQIIYNLENISELDISYKLNLQFEVEIPTLSYVQDLYEDFGYDFTSERSILRRSKELVDYWNKHKNADSRTVTVEYSLDITPNIYGNFNYQFSFLEWEYLLRASSSALNTEFDSYSVKERSALLAFMHVKKITSEVVTTRADSVVYGGYTTNVFERGVYDSCVEAYTRADKNFVDSDLLEDWINDDLRDAEEAYRKELEDRVNDLENQLGDLTDIQNGFGGNLDTTNVWTSFTNLIQGLASFAPAIAGLSSLAGIVLGFLPLQVSGVIASTLLAICIIALIKAIRG